MTNSPISQDKILQEIELIEEIMKEFGVDYKDAEERYHKIPGFYKTRYTMKDKYKLQPNERKGKFEEKR